MDPILHPNPARRLDFASMQEKPYRPNEAAQSEVSNTRHKAVMTVRLTVDGAPQTFQVETQGHCSTHFAAQSA